ncbi:unnamed protein product [Pelagomonas calceolata]|uniref:U-box domain-containing protein n=1 Tax=Pelagomonas calceolata TaxID=35677 RepID=A0A8J2SZM5_9STRA|nr:unnamed protein product [Pelagomonas calceolata]
MANETPAVRETLSRDAELLEPLASEAAAEAPPMAPAFVMGPDGLMYPAPPAYDPYAAMPMYGGPMYPGAYAPPPPMALAPPPPDTIFQGTVTNFGNFNKDGRASRHCYGFIKIDHSGNEVFVSEEDAPDGYLSQGDRCKFRIVDARTKNRRTGAPQWKATDVVCIQRAEFMGPIQIKAIDRELVDLVEANGGEMRVTRLAERYVERHGKPLDVRAVGYKDLRQFVMSSRRLIYDPRVSPGEPTLGGLVRLAPGSAKQRDAELKAREQALIEREEALAKREADARDFPPLKSSPAAPREPGVSEAMRHLSLEPKRDESKTEPVPAGYTVVAAVLQHLDETRLLPTFLAQQIDDAALPYLEPTDLIELGVAPMTCLAILGASAAGGKQKKLETQDVLHDVATHQSVLEKELAEHRAELQRLRISTAELPEDMCCSITCELMKEPYLCVGDSHTYERVAIEQWFATGARTSPTTNERLDNLTLVPNHAMRRLILALLERRRDASGADETKGPS